MGMAAIAGLTYLSYMGHRMRMNATPEQRLSLYSPVVQQRLRTTMGYFTASIVGTGALMSMWRSSAFINNPLVAVGLGGLSWMCLFGTILTDYDKNRLMKNLFYGGFVACTAASLTPMLHVYGGAVCFDAALCTAATMGGLGLVAYNAPSEQFLWMGGVLSIALGGLCGASILHCLYPASAALFNMNIYGGIGLFGLFTLYDT